jgi:hypothetical protein
MEIWARCDRCERWFYCSADSDESTWTCPVCRTDPVAVVRQEAQ